MLTIRKSQIDEMLKNKEENFVDRMVEHIANNFSAEISKQGMNSKDLKPIIQRTLESSFEYNIEYENDVVLYIECIALLGEEFYINNKYPAVIEILNRNNLTGTEKMDQISEYITFELE